MRLVSVSMVRNEQDIIESFVRHQARFLDEIIILDNGSVDETPRILSLLQQEGLPLRLHFDPIPAYLQSRAVTEMVCEGFADCRADMVIPLDVDEFLHTRHSGGVRQVLETLPEDRFSTVEWMTYVPTPGDDYSEVDPLVRIGHRRATQHNHDSKILIPARAWADASEPLVAQGSHSVRDAQGNALRGTPVGAALWLAHFPLRSPAQMQAKYLVGWLANLARPERVLFDWLPQYHRAKQGLPSLEELRIASLTYNILDKGVEPGLVRDPIGNVVGLRYTPLGYPGVLPLVLSIAEELADQVSLGLGRVVPLATELPDRDIYRRIEGFRSIDGWLSHREAVALFRVTAALRSVDPVVCEIGSWVGKSSYVLARALQFRGDAGSLICVDPMDGSGDASSSSLYQREMAGMPEGLEAEFWRSLRTRGVDGFVSLVRGQSSNVSGQVPESLDLLFIDGDHSYAAVRRDFEEYSPRIRSGGHIALHDVGSTRFCGPKRVVETCIVPSSNWKSKHLVDELFVAEKV